MFFFFRKIIFTFCVFCAALYSAQEHSNSKDSLATTAVTSEKDLGDVIKKIFKKKGKDSATAEKKIFWSVVPAVGYTLQTGFAGIISANIGFNLGKSPYQKMSSINTGYTYSQYKQTIIPVYANIWTKDNKINFLTDFRYLDYPSDIYGLGGKRITIDQNSNTGYTINFKAIKFHQTALFSLRNNMYVGGGIYYDQFWNIKISDSVGKRVERLIRRDLGTSERAVGIALKFLYDSRTNQINSDKGWYTNVVFRPNFKFLGSDHPWSSLLIDARKYVKFPANSHNVLAFWGMAWLTPSKNEPPYLLMPSTGWDDQYNTGRGYIQGRFRGKNELYYENEYRFRISRNGLFGGVVFGNVQKFSGNLSEEYKKLNFGYGLGVRIRINKKSNTNLCLDYGLGEYGSKGFFVNLGEVF